VLIQRIFGRCWPAVSAAFRGIWGSAIAAAEPATTCMNRRLLISYFVLIMNVTSISNVQNDLTYIFNVNAYTQAGQLPVLIPS
jgi:hypothetical protein